MEGLVQEEMTTGVTATESIDIAVKSTEIESQATRASRAIARLGAELFCGLRARRGL